MNGKIVKILFFLSTLPAILFFQACSCRTCNQQDVKPEVPLNKYSRADSYIIAQVGHDFFEKYIHADFLGSKKSATGYELHYSFKMNQYDFVDEPITIRTDTNGVLLTDYTPSGIPTCVLNDSGCTFDIDKKKAVKIASDNGLPEGVKDWLVEFRWSDVVDKYVWHIIATTRQFGSGQNYKAAGEEMMIDPTNGQVLKRRQWQMN